MLAVETDKEIVLVYQASRPPGDPRPPAPAGLETRIAKNILQVQGPRVTPGGTAPMLEVLCELDRAGFRAAAEHLEKWRDSPRGAAPPKPPECVGDCAVCGDPMAHSDDKPKVERCTPDAGLRKRIEAVLWSNASVLPLASGGWSDPRVRVSDIEAALEERF